MLIGGIAAAWLGAGYLRSIPKSRMMGVIAVLLLVTAVLLAVETGSGIGAMLGGYLAAWAPADMLRLVLATILAASAVKLWSKREPER
jgi:uncharacterized membrane protein YfcA